MKITLLIIYAELSHLLLAREVIPKISPYARVLSKKSIFFDPFLKNFKIYNQKELHYLDLAFMQMSADMQEDVKNWMSELTENKESGV